MEAAAALAGRACASLVVLVALRPLTLLGQVLLAGLALVVVAGQPRQHTLTERMPEAAETVGEVTSCLSFSTQILLS